MSARDGEGSGSEARAPTAVEPAAAAPPEVPESEQIARRREKLNQLGDNPWPNDFRPNATTDEVRAAWAAALEAASGETAPKSDDDATAEDAAAEAATAALADQTFKIAGRLMTRRVMGKASFAHLQDRGGRLQLHVRRDELEGGADAYREFRHWDIGDIIAAEGTAFVTRTGELSLRVTHLRLLAKALRPLPEKFHGLTDREAQYRSRHLHLIMSEEARELFRMRARIIDLIRRFLIERDYLEVETPMMQPLASGAAARPFETWHNALGIPLFLRVAPELYLKRLVVGGFERVFEINRNFRNEGLSTRHNPEFTMLEFYEAYADYEDLMTLTEEMLRELAREVLGRTTLSWQGADIDLEPPFRRVALRDAVLAHYGRKGLTEEMLDNPDKLHRFAEAAGVAVAPGMGPGKVLLELFEHEVEPNLLEPTFITRYPTEVSPLSRHTDGDDSVTDRFELFIGGREIANGFSELNDPDEQRRRFQQQEQQRTGGDEEAMRYDEDYVTALEYGMPPTAGEGLGIDRLVMLFTDAASIRDVILFPHLRPRDTR